MTSYEPIFADSNFFIALFNLNDTLYSQALKTAKKLENDNATLIISNFIFLEVVTVLSLRRDRQTALAAGDYLLSEPRIKVLHVDERLQRSTWKIFRQLNNKNIGFVDCSIIALMQDEAIHTLLTFDIAAAKHLRKFHVFNLY